MIIDAQVHIWADNSPERQWPEAGQAGRTAVPHRIPAYGAHELLADMDAAGIDRAVIVPPSWEGERNDVAAAAHAAFPQRLAFMGRLDVRSAGAGEELARIAATPGALGVRLLVGGDIAVEDLAGLDWLWGGLADAGLSVMLAPRGNFEAIAGLAQRHAKLRITIDHLGAFAHRKGDEAFAAVERMLPLAALGNVAVKASAMPDYSALGPPYADVEPHVRRVFNAFGASRVFFGSDITRLPLGYGDLLAMFDSFAWLRGRERELVLGEAVRGWLGGCLTD